MPRTEPGREATLGWSVIALALSWTMVFLTVRQLSEDDKSIPFVPVVFLILLYVALADRTMRLGLPPVARSSVIWAGMGAVGSWCLLLIPAYGVLFVATMAAIGAGHGSGPGIATPFNFAIALVLIVAAGSYATWRFSSAFARNLGEGPPAWLVAATVLSCGAICLGIGPLLAELKPRLAAMREREAEAQRAELARQQPILLEGRCAAGDKVYCFWLAGALRAGSSGISRDVKRALSLYARACDAGNPPDCFEAGTLYAAEADAPIDFPRAAALFDRACTLNREKFGAGPQEYPGYCERAGLSYLDERARNVPRAVELLTRTCELESTESCARLGALYLDGTLLPQDPAHAFRLLKKACDDAAPLACYQLGSMYRAGTGVAQDRAKAEALYDRACPDEAEPEGEPCQAVQRECEADMPRSCFVVARAIRYRDGRRAAALYDRACASGVADACVSEAILHRDGSKTLQQDLERARQLFKRACDLDSKSGGCVEASRH